MLEKEKLSDPWTEGLEYSEQLIKTVGKTFFPAFNRDTQI